MSVVDVVVVGGGPAGLAAAIALRDQGVARVVVLEREREPGGIPRHTDHLGYGLRDLHRVMTGPDYARRYADLAEHAGVELRTETSATGWEGGAEGRTLQLTSPAGRTTLTGRAVVLATGCRERSRAARLIPGDRPAGVLTTGLLQQLVTLHHAPVGHLAVVVGAEHVSFSAVLTLRRAGCEVAAVVTDLPRHSTYAGLVLLTATAARVPVRTSTRLAEIRGRARVTSVVLEHVVSGARDEVVCDTVVCTGDWVPDHELARLGHVPIDAGHLGPTVDDGWRTLVPGLFAVGNLVHAAETADRCARAGRAVAGPVADWLATGRWTRAAVAVRVAPPLGWVSPNRLGRGGVALSLRAAELAEGVHLQVVQAGRTAWTSRRRDLVPGLPLHLPARATRSIDPRAGPVALRVLGGGAGDHSDE